MSEPEDYERRSRNNMIVLVAILVVIGLGVLLMHALKKNQDLQDCLSAGHHDCEPVDTDR
jgi:hypothetical protein